VNEVALPMRRHRILLLPLCVACGSSAAIDAPGTPDASALVDAPVDASAPGDAASAADARIADGRLADAGPIVVVPDPGTDPMPMSWPDTEPNDTPEQAVRLGVGSGQIGPYVGFRAGGGHLGGGDAADAFVFRTSSAAGTTFIASACWDAGLNVNLLDFALYQVVDGQPLIPVASSSSTNTACEYPQPFWSLPLEPDTKYLFVLTHVDGEGTYEA
jgi:hypothetical protein